MRKLPLGVAISVIVHVGVLAYVALVVLPGTRRAEPAATPPVTIEVIPVLPRVEPAAEAPAMEVVLLDEPATEPASQPAPQPPAPSATRAPAPAVAIATTAHAGSAAELPSGPATTAAGPEAPPTGGPGKSALAMRHGEAPSVALPAGMFDDTDHVPRGTIPEVQIRSGKLDNDGVDKKSDQGVFNAKVAADGTVKLIDKPNISGLRVGPLPAGHALKDWIASDKFHPEAGDPAIASKYQAAPGTTINLGSSRKDDLGGADDGDGGMAVIEGSPGRVTMVFGLLSGHFDATDALMRRHGMDPYLDRKLKFLDSTRDERVQLGNRHRAYQLAHATELMLKNLTALWAAPGDLAAKKRALFEVWDECADAGDAVLVDGAADARRLVIGFIRGHLPAGSASAYTADELAELTRHQQSKAEFQPYEP